MVQEKIVKKKKIKKRYWAILALISLIFYMDFSIMDGSIYLYSQYEPKPTSIEMLRFMIENKSKLMTLFDEDGDELYYDDDGSLSLHVRNKESSSYIDFYSKKENKLLFSISKNPDSLIPSDSHFYIFDKNNNLYSATINMKEIEINQTAYDMFESDFQKFYQPVYEKSKAYEKQYPKYTIFKWLFDLRYKPRK